MERVHQRKSPKTAQSFDSGGSPRQFKMAPPFELTAGEVKAPDPVVKDAYVAKETTRELGFALRHPLIAMAIGTVSPGTINISTNAVRFSTNDLHLLEPTTHGQEGSEVNAFRHALWSGTIKSHFGQQIAEEVGNAHESNPLAIAGQGRNTMHFPTRALADESCDLRNNEIGRAIGSSSDPEQMNVLALRVIDYFREHGLWCAEPQRGGSWWTIQQRKISEGAYRVARHRLLQLNEKGFDSRQQAAYDLEIKKNMEKLPKTR
jgi:hypothetical protein